MGAIYEHLRRDQGASQAQAKAALRQWEIRKLTMGGREVGELMLSENEVHFALEPWCRRVLGRGKLMDQTLDALLKEKGFLVTRLFKGDRWEKLVLFMGFRRTWSDGKYVYYWMDEETRHDRDRNSAN